ncbi:DUF1932 domain-containing protein [Rhodobacterales bacterium HKCCSP123]|nr:DUF1932 domain-containing protein [Rhodobacterales bacterium HKCCSP123]
MTETQHPQRLAFIGFGEAARAFLAGWADRRPAAVTAYDRKTDAGDTAAAMRAAYADHAVDGAATAAQAVAQADTVFCTVTADQARVAAEEAALNLAPGTLWFDCNSCAPGTKTQAAAIIEGAGGRYVDVAVMSPVHPRRHHAPLLVSGPWAETGAARLQTLDMRPRVVGPEVGQASSIKMLRSVMIKGLEALTAECFLAARRAGVSDQVIASLEASDPEIAWRARGAYNLERMLVHGARRAAEMREVALTVEALGLSPGLSRATAAWQESLAGLAGAGDDPDLDTLLDRVLARL